MAKQPIKAALGLGERIELADGTYIDCVPATLADLEDAMIHYANSLLKMPLQGCFLPGNEEAKQAVKELLFIACGRKIPQEELMTRLQVGPEVQQFVDRFLGLNVAETRSAETKE